MKIFISGLLGLVIACEMFVSLGSAAIIISFGAPPSFQTNSGIQSIPVFANSTLVGGEVGVGIAADFALGGGALFNTPNAGTFGDPGFIGNGNINFGASSFDRDTTPGSFNIGSLNLTFQNFAGSIPNTPTPLATLLVNTANLALANYPISVTNGFFGIGSIANASGSFSITAVPEPSSILLCGLGVAGLWYQRRRSRMTVSA
jgi:hypothetical protein